MVRDARAGHQGDSPISRSRRQFLAAKLGLPVHAYFVALWPQLVCVARAINNNRLLTAGIVVLSLPLLFNALWVLPRPNVQPPIPGYSYATQARISSWNDPRLARRYGESALDFAGRISTLVHKATYNCDATEVGQSWWTALAYRLGLLNVEQGLLSLETFRCGFCHARAYIVAGALRKGGIADATALSLYGHVVATFHLDGKRYVTDPDFGVYPFALPEDATALRKAVERTYIPIMRAHGILAVANVVDLYISKEDNTEFSFDYLNQLRERQDKILAWQRPIEIWCAGAGLAIIALHFLLRLLQTRRVA